MVPVDIYRLISTASRALGQCRYLPMLGMPSISLVCHTLSSILTTTHMTEQCLQLTQVCPKRLSITKTKSSSLPLSEGMSDGDNDSGQHYSIPDHRQSLCTLALRIVCLCQFDPLSHATSDRVSRTMRLTSNVDCPPVLVYVVQDASGATFSQRTFNQLPAPVSSLDLVQHREGT